MFLSLMYSLKNFKQFNFLCTKHKLFFEHTGPHSFIIFFSKCLTISKNSHVGILALPLINLI